MGKYVIALDQGTTSSRCILFDEQGMICSVAQKEFTQIFPQPGWVEHNPMEIWSSQLSVTMEAMGKIGAGRAAVWNRGYVADLEPDQGLYPCDRLYERIENHAV